MRGCKMCPAFGKCTVCEALRGLYGADCDPEIKTNVDRIRAMSDEELNIFLYEVEVFADECPCAYGGKEALAWLQQPAEENNDLSQ